MKSKLISIYYANAFHDAFCKTRIAINEKEDSVLIQVDNVLSPIRFS